MRQIVLLIFFIALISNRLYGQYDIRNIGRIKGLYSGTVTCVSQDLDGFIWIATSDGLLRYDGFELKEYKNSNIRGKDVLEILIDSKGRMWVGTTDGGLSIYNKETDSFRNFGFNENGEGTLPSNDVRGLHEDSEGNVWVATKHSLNLYVEREDQFKVYNEPFINTLLKDIISDEKGNIWCATMDRGLFKFIPSNESFVSFLNEESIVPPKVQCIAYDGKDILMGTRDQGLLSFSTVTKSLRPVFSESSSNYSANIWDLLFDESTGRLWLGMDGHGLVTLQKNNGNWEEQSLFQNMATSKFLSNSIYSVFIDRDKNLWLGSAWHGLFVLEHLDNPIEFIGDVEGEKLVSVWSSYCEGNKIWLGTDGNGLFIHNLGSGLENGELKTHQVKNFYSGLKITLIKKRKDGNYWLGTYSNGLILFSKDFRELKRYSWNPEDPTSISANQVRDILPDSKGGYWVATWGGGLNYLDEETGKFTSYQFDPNNEITISNNNVIDLRQAPEGKIWVATFGGGVNLLDPEKRTFKRYQYDFTRDYGVAFSSKNITAIHDDKKGHLWLGTWNTGLKRIDQKEGRVTEFDQYPALTDQTICGILEDKAGGIWINTVETVFKYEAELDTMLEYADLSGEYQFGSVNQDEQGRLYLGGLNGVVSFDPLLMKNHVHTTEVVFTDFKLFNKQVELGDDMPLDVQINYAKEVNLNYDQRVITFDFAAMKFPSSEDCKYAIKMKNFDREWRDNGTNRSATYTNLSPGRYEFQVRSFNSDGSISSEVASIPVFIAKPYWATWWAYTIYLLLFLLMLYLFRKYNIYWEKMKSQLKLEQLEREKTTELHEMKLRFFTNISHEIRTPVTLILGSINRLLALGITEKIQVTALQNIKKNSSHLLSLVSELLDFRKLELGEARLKVAEGNMVKFVQEIFLSFNETAQRKNIDYHFNVKRPEIQAWYDRDEMEKVLYNIISNAFKYTDEGGGIEVAVDADDQHLYMRVEDTGRGIPSDQLKEIFKRFYQSDNNPTYKNNNGYGLGLAITYDIVKLHGGEILAESQLNEGSTFTIKLPLGNDHIKSEFLIEEFRDSEQLSHYTYEDDEKVDSNFFNFPNQVEMTVLVAEDNDDIRGYLHELLSPHFTVLLAKNGLEALELTLEHLPDLILSDVMMPEMDGITFSSKVKHDPRTSHIPVIILTARTALIYKKEGLDVGVDDYITKPFSEVLLKTRIRNLLNNRMLIREKYKTDLLIQPSELAMRSPDEEFLKNISEVIEEHLSSDDMSTEFLCKELGMSQSNVYKKLKALTGMSIIEFVRDFRLKRAVQLIVNQKLSVSEACYKVGFSDRRYFSQVFKSKYGMTPSQYAKAENSEELQSDDAK
ncbi:two-component regulator propeller domain-containing protein [Marinoscillum sp. MHG1-6]|uniref:two-component regulator propeller domain-containing protein n=1 Tax=Marinoscillum sp. MHG1-6 TaxID=2959627 RepID=UPI002157745F|nr:two-component regulator propeller domain-containing protein [Marinoscillum sp. MHG1-6]